MNNHNNFAENTSQYYEKQAKNYPYVDSKDYSNFESVCQSFPHLKNINQPYANPDQNTVNGIVIRSANDDNVHKAIKYGIWTTTPKNRLKIDNLWKKNNHQNPKHTTYLFFSVVKSGMFEGVAKLTSGMHQQTFPFWWDNYTLKFQGYFKLEWVYLKDINNKHFDGLYSIEGQQVTKSKDCDSLDSQTTVQMLQIFSKRPNKRNIFNDFKHMDDRQKKYIRPLYDQMIQSKRQMQNPMNMYQNMGMMNGYIPMGGIQMNPVMYQMHVNNMVPPPMSNLPMQGNHTYVPLAKNQKPSGLGFQKNPVSKNRKKQKN